MRRKTAFLLTFSDYSLVMHLPEFGLNPFSDKIWLTRKLIVIMVQ